MEEGAKRIECCVEEKDVSSLQVVRFFPALSSGDLCDVVPDAAHVVVYSYVIRT